VLMILYVWMDISVDGESESDRMRFDDDDRFKYEITHRLLWLKWIMGFPMT
jgi:hypothetical protein